MSTDGSFNPPDNPCPDDVFTAAQIVALRDSGQLRPECHYIVAGPTIGTPGNQAPTVLEVHAVTPSTLSKEVKVGNVWNPEGAFWGVWDPDADTAGGGTLNELLDHWANRLTDEDPGNSASHTVHNQFPYHLSGPTLRDNTMDDVDLPGLAAAVAAGLEFRDNVLRETSVDTVGVTAGFFRRNTVTGGATTLRVPSAFVNGNHVTDSAVSHQGAGAGSFSFQNNTMQNGTVGVDAATTVSVTVNNNTIGGTSGGYRVSVAGKTGGLVIFSGNRAHGASLGSYDFQAGGAGGNAQVTGCDIEAGSITLNGTGNETLTNCTFKTATVTHTGPGLFQLTRAQLDNSTVSHLGNGQVAVTDTAMTSTARLLVLAGQTGVVSLSACTLQRLYTMQFEATSSVIATINGSTFSGHTNNPSGVDMQVDGSGSRTIANSRIVADVTTTALVLLGSGSVSISQGSDLPGGRVLRDAATTAALNITRSRIPGTVEQTSGATGGGLTIDTCDGAVVGTTVTQRGPGSMVFNSCRLGAGVRNSATATRGLSMASCDLQGGSFDQNRTGGTGTDICDGVTLRGSLSSITLNGAVDPGGNQTPLNTVTVSEGGALVLNDPAGTGLNSIVMQRSVISGGAQVSGTGTQLVDACRFAAGAVVDMGAFTHSFTIIEGQFTKTLTASNIGRLCNKGFDDTI